MKCVAVFFIGNPITRDPEMLHPRHQAPRARAIRMSSNRVIGTDGGPRLQILTIISDKTETAF